MIISEQEMRKIIADSTAERGGKAALARELGVVPQHVSAILVGGNITSPVAAHFGYKRRVERIVTFETLPK
jgi:hypothetical protein